MATLKRKSRARKGGSAVVGATPAGAADLGNIRERIDAHRRSRSMRSQ